MAAVPSTTGYKMYSTVTGYFLQDEPQTDPTTFQYVRPSQEESKRQLTHRDDDGQNMTHLGLIDRPYECDGDSVVHHSKTQWQRFEDEVQRLQHQAGRDVQYKVLYLARHGEGTHNVAEAFYGTPAWDVSV